MSVGKPSGFSKCKRENVRKMDSGWTNRNTHMKKKGEGRQDKDINRCLGVPYCRWESVVTTVRQGNHRKVAPSSNRIITSSNLDSQPLEFYILLHTDEEE